MNLAGIPTRQFDVLTTMPDELRAPRESSDWALANKPGERLDAFIEGPVFLDDGRLAVTDIPYGRILTISQDGQWEVLIEYEGEPNGMAKLADGSLVIADYSRGLLRLDLETRTLHTLLSRRNTEGFKGLNDVIATASGALFFTDQGQTGLHDPTGRVFRYHEGRLDQLISNGISPNGLVLDPAGEVLFVAMTRDNSVWRVPLRSDGSVAKVGRFCQMFGSSGPDGLSMTASGELLVAHASLGSVFRYAPNGELLERIVSRVGQTVTNLTFDTRDSHRIVAVESSSNTVLAATLDTPGIV